MPDKFVLKPYHCPANGKICVGRTCKLWSEKDENCEVVLIRHEMVGIVSELQNIRKLLSDYFL